MFSYSLLGFSFAPEQVSKCVLLLENRHVAVRVTKGGVLQTW